jgi:hypothetical protein
MTSTLIGLAAAVGFALMLGSALHGLLTTVAAVVAVVPL